MKLTDFTEAEVNVKKKGTDILYQTESICYVFNNKVEDTLDFWAVNEYDLEGSNFGTEEISETFIDKELGKEKVSRIPFETKK